MTWKKARAGDARETVLVSTATNFREIGNSLGALIGRMEADWLADGATRQAAIFIDINSTEGHLMVTWDVKGGGGAFTGENSPNYYLELRALWREAEDHVEGAHHFDRQVHFAICSCVEEMQIAAQQAGEAGPYEVYELFEGSTHGAQRVVV